MYHLYGYGVVLLRGLLEWDWEVQITHTYREDNFCTDWFAKLGARNGLALKIWRNTPSDLKPFLVVDANGTQFVRLSAFCFFSFVTKKCMFILVWLTFFGRWRVCSYVMAMIDGSYVGHMMIAKWKSSFIISLDRSNLYFWYCLQRLVPITMSPYGKDEHHIRIPRHEIFLFINFFWILTHIRWKPLRQKSSSQ